MKKITIALFLLCLTTLSQAGEEFSAPDFSKLDPKDMKESEESTMKCTDATGTYSPDNTSAYRLCIERQKDGSSALVPLGHDQGQTQDQQNSGESASKSWKL